MDVVQKRKMSPTLPAHRSMRVPAPNDAMSGTIPPCMDFRFHATIKAYTEKDEAGNEIRFIRGVASDDQIDRQGERFSTRAVQRMVETAKQNLTLFGDHNHSWENTLGHIVDAKFNDGAFEVVCQLESEEAQPKIKQLWAKLKSKTRLAFSIGGRVLKVIAEEVNGQTVRVLDDLELLEISVVGIPANPRTWLEAIVKSLEGHESNQESIEEGEMSEKERVARAELATQELEAAQAAAMEKLKSEHESVLAALRAEHDKATKAEQEILRQAQDEGKTFAEKLAGVEKELADIRVKFDAALADVKTLTNERDALAGQVLSLESAIKDKAAETAKIQGKATELQAEFERLSLSLTETNAAYEDLRVKYEQMSSAQTENTAFVEAGKKFKEMQMFEAHRLAGLVEGETFNSDTTKKKLGALAFDDLQKEIEQLRKRVDEKFPPTGVSVTPLAGTEDAAEERQAKVRDLLKDGAPLFEEGKVNG